MKRAMEMVLWLVCLCFLFSPVWTAQPVRAKDEILIGKHNPLSGIGSLVGKYQNWAYSQAIKDINQKGKGQAYRSMGPGLGEVDSRVSKPN
jgi:ABC-type branched-subunit amino acid transport system substrate-binding protein